jgi:hypothetical protein
MMSVRGILHAPFESTGELPRPPRALTSWTGASRDEVFGEGGVGGGGSGEFGSEALSVFPNTLLLMLVLLRLPEAFEREKVSGRRKRRRRGKRGGLTFLELPLIALPAQYLVCYVHSPPSALLVPRGQLPLSLNIFIFFLPFPARHTLPPVRRVSRELDGGSRYSSGLLKATRGV